MSVVNARVVFVTGGVAGDAPGYYAARGYRGLRQEEAGRAAAILGVDDLRQTLAPCDFRYELWATVQPTHVIDISPVWEQKKKAVEQYENQLRNNDYLYMIAGLNAYRTIHWPSARYVEAFEQGRPA